MTNKFADHLPLYRGEDIFARAGVMIPRNTQFGMLLNVVTLIAPLVALMKSRVVSGSVLGVDDTSVRLQDASLPGKMRTARFWLYRGQEDNPYNVFDFTENRGRDGPAEFLKDFRGHAVVDAYGVHEGIDLGKEDPIFAACCNDDLRVLPKSKLGKAVRYALNQWDELTVFLDNGAIPIDNNATESELRRLTIGRKNWLFVGSSRGGEVAASMCSLEAALRRWPTGQPIRRVGMTRVELEWLIGDLSHVCVKGKAGRDLEAVADLCDPLEYAQQTGDGDLDLW